MDEKNIPLQANMAISPIKLQNLSLRKQFLLLFGSILLLFFITLFAKKYTHYPQDTSEIKLIDNRPNEVKVAPKSPSGVKLNNQDKSVFDILDN